MSAVIATCNRARLLEKALGSVQSQTHSPLEIVVVDDGSTDETASVVSRYAAAGVRYVRHDTRRGGAAARNTGIRAAAGEFVAFLDDDDEWEPEKTEAQLSLLLEGGFDAVLCMYSMGGRAAVPKYSSPQVTLDELRAGFARGGSASALIARTGVLREIGFDESLPKCQDWDLCIRMAGKYRLGCVNRPLVRYNDGAHDRISNRIVRIPTEELGRQLRMLDKHRGFFGPVWYRRHMCHFLLYGISRRANKTDHLKYVVARVGILQLLRTAFMRYLARLPRGQGVS